MTIAGEIYRHPKLCLLLSLLLSLLAAGQLATSLLHLDSTAIWRASEARPAVVAREMVESGNFVIPTVNGKPRLQKPPLFYWAAVPFVNMSERLSALSVRLPSMLFGSLLILVLGGFVWHRRQHTLTDPRIPHNNNADVFAALLSGALLLGFFGFWQQTLEGEAEAMLALGNFLVVICLYENLRRQKPGLLLAAYVLSGIGLLIKGPILLMFCWPAYFWLARGQLRTERYWHLLGFAIMLALPLLWVGAIYIRLPEALNVFSSEIGGRFGGKAPHQQAIYFYFTELLVRTAPLSLWVPMCIYSSWKLARHSRPETYLVYSFLIGLLGLTYISSKQTHYLMPLYPFVALFMGDLLRVDRARMPTTHTVLRWVNLTMLSLGILVSLGLGAAIIGWLIGDFLTGAIWTGCALLGILLLIYTRRHGTLTPLILTWACSLAFASFVTNSRIIEPAQSVRRAHRAFFHSLEEVADGRAVASNLDDERLIFYFPKRVTPVASAADLQAFRAGEPEGLFLLDGTLEDSVIPGKLRAVLYTIEDTGIRVWQPAADSAATPEANIRYPHYLPTTATMSNHATANTTATVSSSCGTFAKEVSGSLTVLSVSVRDNCSLYAYVRMLNDYRKVFIAELTPWKVLRYHVEFGDTQPLLADLQSKLKADLFNRLLHTANVDFLVTDGALIPVQHYDDATQTDPASVIELADNSPLSITARATDIEFGYQTTQADHTESRHSWQKTLPTAD